ncbi:sulfate ABC transporter substrate-binding protein [Aurantimonas endophytica]|uniref:Sulfate transport system substrate-binding protein n=1 Tax=Aurantimonas endophytica TaxID=1522175 RepID=A0A7W6MNP2_9HYPH|nr:sulfate ABC transporter substrate-binding protein [Aurantimonas endophytica]MBB4002160.1 sulfate transport system substrate-binding protein [Aurantimonas endophytica]MCO6402211.1 sulfate ABC transporter substrate-binding protein [Aurantimonas endophytica]
MLLNRRSLLLTAALAASLPLLSAGASIARETLNNVSYDPTRELYREYGEHFAKTWKEKTGQDVTVSNSHGGSGAQVRSVVEGLPADVVTFPLEGDILGIEEAGLIEPGWQSEFPAASSPYTSTIVFLVRSGNPTDIKDWDDLAREGVEVITPNPKTSGGARWNYLAAWAYELDRSGGDAQKAQDFVASIYRNVPVLDTGARGSTNTFVQNKVGDVLIAWENEALLSLKEFGAGEYEIVVPSLSILAEVKVAIVDKNVDGNGKRELAKAFLDELYSPESQAIFARNFYRPLYPDQVDAADLEAFPEVKLVKIDDVFGGWAKAQPEHFGDGGIFDKIYSND